MAALLIGGLEAYAETVAVGWREAAEVSNDTQSARLVIGTGAEVYKVGGGTWTLPLAQVDRSAPYAINVVSGRLDVVAGAAASASDVPACITEKAAFWADATPGCGLQAETDASGVSRVTRWCDRRETDPQSRVRYSALPAHAVTGLANEDAAAPTVTNVLGNASVYFGGVGSGQYMAFKTAADANLSLANVVHFFLVHYAHTTWGPILGHTTNGGLEGFRANSYSGSSFGMVPGSMSGYFNMPERGDQHGYLFTARYFQNGNWIDAFTTPPLRGFELFSATMNENCQKYNNFFRQRTESKVIGGDFLSEAILFTNRLSEAELVQVERYLMGKWRLVSRDTSAHDLSRDVGRIAIASGATVAASPASGEEAGPLAFSGRGTVEKDGEGTLVIGPSGDKPPFEGTFALKAGKVAVRGGSVPALAVKGGDVLDARFTSSGNNLSAAQQLVDGNDLTLAAGAAADTVRKTGNAEARVSSIAAGVSRVSVEGGSLVLAAQTVSREAFGATPVAGVNVRIPDASFESYFIDNPTATGVSPAPSTYGWTFNTCRLYTPADGAWATYSPATRYAAEGKSALLLKSTQATAYTTVTIPQAGEYEFSCATTTRDESNLYPLGIYFGSTWNSAVHVGTILNCKTAYPRTFCRFTVAAAGNYTLGFKAVASKYADGGYMVDDLKLRLVTPAPSATSTYPVPNGDFESVVSGTKFSTTPSTNMQLTGWTLDASAASLTNEVNSGVAAVSLCQHIACVKDTFVSQAANPTVGTLHLLFTKNGGKATTAPFSPPKGTYHLTGKAAYWDTNVYSMPDKVERSASANLPVLKATLVRAGGESVALGTFSPRGHLFVNCFWPAAFEIAEGESVSLVLEQTEPYAAALVDDLCLVAADEVDAGELVANGGFERPFAASGFQAVSGTSGYVWKSDRQVGGDVGVASNFGYSLYEGSYQIQVGCDGGVWESVTFPTPGLYRLRFAAHTRTGNRNTYGRNPLRATLQSGDGKSVLNDIVTVRPFGANYCEYSALFRVAEAGTHRLVIRGTSLDPSHNDRRSYLDGVSVRKVAGVTQDVPDVPERLRLAVAADARLQLDFTGTLKVRTLRLDGIPCLGRVNASTHPDFISGAGSLEVAPEGSHVIIR